MQEQCVGVDVSKQHLDWVLGGEGAVSRVNNTPAGSEVCYALGDTRSASTIQYAPIRMRSWWEENGLGRPVSRQSRQFSQESPNANT